MLTTICFDFGNTRLKYAVFADGDLQAVHVLKDDREETIRTILEKYRPDKSILSSVIDHNPGMEELLTAETRFHKLNHHSRVPVTTPVGKPETIGADRLALVVAAGHFYPGVNNLVIGLGSAITYNYINRFLQFVGGSISPGMEMRLNRSNCLRQNFPGRTPLEFPPGGL